MSTFATYNIKGGVGKTATAVNLAYLSARGGARTLVWDLDPQGAATFYFRVKAKVKGGGRALVHRERRVEDLLKGTDHENLDLLPADFSYRHLDLFLDEAKKPRRRLGRVLKPLLDDYDHVFLDCPPSISLVSESVFRAADALLVPLIPTTLSVRTLRQLMAFHRDEGLGSLRVLPFFSMVDARKSLHREVLETLPQQFPGVLRSSIPQATEVERMGVHRAPVATFASGRRAAAAYEALWAEILEELGA